MSSKYLTPSPLPVLLQIYVLFVGIFLIYRTLPFSADVLHGSLLTVKDSVLLSKFLLQIVCLRPNLPSAEEDERGN